MIDALQDYYKQDTEQSKVMISYLCLMELEKNIEYLQNNIDKLDTKGKFSLANLLLEQGKYEESIEIYDKLNLESPKWSCPWRHKGEALLKSGKLEESEKALLKAIETRKEHYDAYIMLAEVQKKLGENREALKAIEKGFSFKGKDIEEPEEEISAKDTQKLYLELLKLNNNTAKYNEMKKKYDNEKQTELTD